MSAALDNNYVVFMVGTVAGLALYCLAAVTIRRAQARAFADRANAMTASWSAEDAEWGRVWAVIEGGKR